MCMFRLISATKTLSFCIFNLPFKKSNTRSCQYPTRCYTLKYISLTPFGLRSFESFIHRVSLAQSMSTCNCSIVVMWQFPPPPPPRVSAFIRRSLSFLPHIFTRFLAISLPYSVSQTGSHVQWNCFPPIVSKRVTIPNLRQKVTARCYRRRLTTALFSCSTYWCFSCVV